MSRTKEHAPAIYAPIIFEFDDYHLFLRAWCEAKKAVWPGFSYQWLANKVGLKSRSFLRLVGMGEKDLSGSAAVRLSKAMGMDARETAYFEALVAWNNATEPSEKGHFLERLRAVVPPTTRTILPSEKYLLFSKWYINPVWELVTTFPFQGAYDLLASKLDPPITGEQAREAVELLLSLGLIERNGDIFAQTQTSLHTGDEIFSRAVKDYQIATLDLAQESLRRHSREVRHISTLTLGLDAEMFSRLLDKIQEFRREIGDLAQVVPSTDRVYQLNLQFFPLTKLPAG
jgi:uncharacterized protein (TIGR02147 family)